MFIFFLKKSRFLKTFNSNGNKTLQICVKQGSVYFLFCPKQGLKIEGGVLHRVFILGFIFVLNRVRV